MTVTLQLEPGLHARLVAEARAQGQSLESYVTSVVAQAVVSEGQPEISLEDFEARLDELAAGSESLPLLPPEAYSRASIYGDGCPGGNPHKPT